MENQELTDLLKAFDEKINRTSAINFQLFDEMQKQKSAAVLDKLRRKRIFEFIIIAPVLLFLGSFLYSNRESLSLAISAGILMFFLIVQLAGNIRQLVLLAKFDYAADVTENQTALASLQTHIITFLRLVILQFPFFLAYIMIGFKVFFNVDIWAEGNKNWLFANLVLSFILLPVSIWAYRQISIENLHRQWVKNIIESAGGKEVSEAMEFLREIEKFKNE